MPRQAYSSARVHNILPTSMHTNLPVARLKQTLSRPYGGTIDARAA